MYEVKLEAFEGPLDLLLHLIKKFEIDIYDISMKHLTDQYFHYINSMTELDINVQSEYLVMASELLRIKSRMLLPSADDEPDDPREELVTQLIEYQNYKYYAALLKDKQLEKDQSYIKGPDDLSAFETVTEVELQLSVVDLMAAYQKAKSRRKLKKQPVVHVARESYSIQEAVDLIDRKLQERRTIKFTELFTFDESRHRLVTIFMALLEMMKLQQVKVTQPELFGEIIINREDI